jgi:hypothetical protein
MAYSAWKRLNNGDVFAVPYTANKSYNITASDFSANQIVINVGINTSSTFDPNTSYKTNGQYDFLVYRSILSNYYSEFFNNTHQTSSIKQTIYVDGTQVTGAYTGGFVDLGNPITTEKFYPTSSTVYVVNVPKITAGSKITPSTFIMSVGSGSVYDDGQYNLLWSGSNVNSSIPGVILSQSSYVGNVFYEQNIAILTVVPNSLVTSSTVGTLPTRSLTTNINNIQYKNNYTVYENFVKCTIKDYEFNASYNPTLLTGSVNNNDTLYNFATASYFTPYVGAIGLYNDAQELLAIAKLAAPMPISSTTDTTFLITYDT